MVNVEDLSRIEFRGRKLIFDNLRVWKERFPFGRGVLIKQICPQVGIRETRRIRGDYVLSADDILSFRQFDDVVTKSPVFWEYGHVFDVPCRCLVPVGVRNLLVAGRCLSASRQAADATRIISTCVGLAAKKQQDVRAVDIGALQGELREQDVELDLHFGAQEYSEEQQHKFHRWFKTLHEVYHYEDEW